ncbi:MAG: 5-formyltetrahydrofolate cyclo-ligase [Ruminococcus sp.]
MSDFKITEEKAMLRAHYRSMRKKMTADYKRKLDLEVVSRFLCSDEYMSAKLILLYCAASGEIETRDLMRAALVNRKLVALPKCGEGNTMKFYYVDSFDKLSKGAYGIMEPDTEKCAEVTDFTDALCVLPGLSFDPQGNRLGSGKGYYDRFLEGFEGTTVGLCYASFVKWSLPADVHDIPAKVLVTDRYIRKTSDK